MQWGLHQFDELTKNPFRGLKALQEPKRTRYVTDDEYRIQYEQAKEMGYLYLPIVFELAYLLSCRGTEVCDLKISDTELSDDDDNKIIKVPRRKGSKTTHIIQSTRLAKAIAKAKALHKIYGLNNCQYLVPASKGGQAQQSDRRYGHAAAQEKNDRQEAIYSTHVRQWCRHCPETTILGSTRLEAKRD